MNDPHNDPKNWYNPPIKTDIKPYHVLETELLWHKTQNDTLNEVITQLQILNTEKMVEIDRLQDENEKLKKEGPHKQIINNVILACKNHETGLEYTSPDASYFDRIINRGIEECFAEGREDLASEILSDIQQSCEDWALTEIKQNIKD